MKSLLGAAVLLCLLESGTYAGDKDGLKWNSMTEGLRLAIETHKPMLIDVYTDWCGWCKKMDRDVYGNVTLGQYLDMKFILVKLNAESTTPLRYQDQDYTEASLASQWGVTGYPTTIFAESDGKLITAVPGYIAPEMFLDVSTYIGGGYYTSMTWDQFKGRKPEN